MNKTAINLVDDKKEIILLIVNSCCVLINFPKVLKLNGLPLFLTKFKQIKSHCDLIEKTTFVF